MNISKFIIFLFIFLTINVNSQISFAANITECSRKNEHVRLTAVGDILVHRALYEQVMGSKNRFQMLWQSIIPQLQSADITYGNLEGAIAPGLVAGGYKKQDPGFVYDNVVYSGTNFSFNYHPYLLDDLKNSGFDVLSTANNHSLDRGSAGVDLTLQHIKQRGLTPVGSRLSQSREPRVSHFESKGFRFAFIACTEMLNGNPDRYQQILSCRSNEVVDEIKRESKISDAVIILPHWGDEYQNRPSSTQKSLAKLWVQAGARAIIGSHPHVLQTTEWLKDSHGENSIVIYSLGNFVAGQAAMERRATALVHLDFEKTNQGLAIAQYSYTPILRPSGTASLKSLAPLTAKPSYEMIHIQNQLGQSHCL